VSGLGCVRLGWSGGELLSGQWRYGGDLGRGIASSVMEFGCAHGHRQRGRMGAARVHAGDHEASAACLCCMPCCMPCCWGSGP
jgi:hypothetical protein